MLDGVRVISSDVEGFSRRTDYIGLYGGYALDGDYDDEKQDCENEETLDAARL